MCAWEWEQLGFHGSNLDFHGNGSDSDYYVMGMGVGIKVSMGI